MYNKLTRCVRGLRYRPLSPFIFLYLPLTPLIMNSHSGLAMPPQSPQRTTRWR